MEELDKLFNEVRDKDTADPVCLDKVLDYWDQIISDADSYMELLVEKLDGATITWSQPWYQGACIFKIPSKELDDKSEATFLEGRITQDESERIDKNWRKLRKKYNLPDKLGSFARWKRRKGCILYKSISNVRLYVTSYLARGLERPIPHVFKHIMSQYGKPRRGLYTNDDKKVIDICFTHDPKQAPTILSDVLFREPRQLYYKLHYAVNGKPECKRICWDLPLATKLLTLLMKTTGEDLNGLKNRKIGIDVWRSIEGEFETLGEYLRHFWYTTLHCQLYCKFDVTLRRVRRRVFKILRRSMYRVWTDIKWKDVVAELPDGLTYQFIYWIVVRVFRADRIHTKLSIPELAQLGLERTNCKLRGNKRLRTLSLNDDGQLEETKYCAKF